MGLFGPTREERHAAAATAIAPYGFVVAPQRARELADWAPFAIQASPERYETAAFGTIDEAEVAAFEYGYSSTDSDGNSQPHTQLIVIAQYPRIEGGAAFSPESREWSDVARAIDALFWIPPFTLLKVIQWLGESRHPDRQLGHAEFDRLYRVRAESDAAAQRAISPRLRNTAVRLAFQGNVELRPGAVIYSVSGCSFDGVGIVRALGYAAPLMVAAAPEPGSYR